MFALITFASFLKFSKIVSYNVGSLATCLIANLKLVTSFFLFEIKEVVFVEMDLLDASNPSSLSVNALLIHQVFLGVLYVSA